MNTLYLILNVDYKNKVCRSTETSYKLFFFCLIEKKDLEEIFETFLTHNCMLTKMSNNTILVIWRRS